MEENLVWATAVPDRHAATSQPASGQPFSAARVVRDAAAHSKQDGAAEERMVPCLLWERPRGFIALGDNSVSAAISAECSFSLSPAPTLTLSLLFAAHLRCHPAPGELHVPRSCSCSCSQCLQGQGCAAVWTLELCKPCFCSADQEPWEDPASKRGPGGAGLCCAQQDGCDGPTAPAHRAACSRDSAGAGSSRLSTLSSTSDCSEKGSSEQGLCLLLLLA